ncbi:MAG TPA: nucleotidyltransferase domain-containing protein [Candidatus Wallbacteria bacterium]|nr:nucleotidyltransferase domain-containing protein [Candidatus Wallbacteria bacterium]
MRISKAIAEFLKAEIRGRMGPAAIYLFGSRADDSKRGGDIDILVISEREADFSIRSKIKINFYKKFGERKLDLVFYRRNDESAFKRLALMEAVEL